MAALVAGATSDIAVADHECPIVPNEGWSANTSGSLVFSVPVTAGFPAIERFFADARARFRGSEWWFGNVYDADGKPLEWW